MKVLDIVPWSEIEHFSAEQLSSYLSFQIRLAMKAMKGVSNSVKASSMQELLAVDTDVYRS